jgi:hypothetical protein
LKTQIIADKNTSQIICLRHGQGRRHDFRLLKESGVRLHKDIQVLVDTGYLGLQKLHAKTTMPKKRSKKNPLTKTDKQQNRAISKERVQIENIIAVIKRFKIIADKYRNRRKRFGLRFTLIAAAYNMALQK